MSETGAAAPASGEAAAPAPGLFRFRYPVEVRFRDLDPMGHVHHSLPLIYFEEARAAYWRDVVGQSGLEGIGYIMGEARVSYHARIRFPQQLEVLVRVSRLGGRSWTMQYRLHGSGGELLAGGESTQIMFDYSADETIPIPDAIRERIGRFEQG